MKMLVTQLCPTFWDPMDCSPPGFPVHGILQARILKWLVYPFSSGSSLLKTQTRVSYIAGRFFTNWDIREAHMWICPLPNLKEPQFFSLLRYRYQVGMLRGLNEIICQMFNILSPEQVVKESIKSIKHISFFFLASSIRQCTKCSFIFPLFSSQS